MTVDGQENAVDEIDAVRVPVGEGTVHGTAFTAKKNRLTSGDHGLAACEGHPAPAAHAGH